MNFNFRRLLFTVLHKPFNTGKVYVFILNDVVTDAIFIILGGLSFIVIIIIIIVAFVIIVSLIAFAIWRWKRSRASSSSKYTMAYLTNNETDTVLLTSGEYAFSYGGGKDGAPKQDHGDGEPA